MRSRWLDAFEGGGAALYAVSGLSSMLLRACVFSLTRCRLARFATCIPGGLMLVENLGVLLAVAGGFTVLFDELLQETRAERP